MGVEEDRGRDAASDTAAPFEETWAWRGGALAGFVATVVMGVAISAMDLATLRGAIAGLYGLEGSLAAGWIAHLSHGTLFGMLFAAFMADPGLYRVSEWYWKTILAGVVYATMLAIGGAGIVMPMWLSLAGVADPPTLPNLTVPLLAWHLLYGVVLGGLYPALEDA
jgi:hypothetical protein